MEFPDCVNPVKYCQHDHYLVKAPLYRNHICRKNYATAILGLENLRKKSQIATQTIWRQNSVNALKCTKTYTICVNLTNIYAKVRKSGTNASAMCVNSTYMCEFHHILRKNFAICVRLCQFFS